MLLIIIHFSHFKNLKNDHQLSISFDIYLHKLFRANADSAKKISNAACKARVNKRS